MCLCGMNSSYNGSWVLKALSPGLTKGFHGLMGASGIYMGPETGAARLFTVLWAGLQEGLQGV